MNPKYCCEVEPENMPDMAIVKHGKWYQQLSSCPSAINNGGSRMQRCSVCGGWGRKTFAYCPHCGAKMELGR